MSIATVNCGLCHQPLGTETTVRVKLCRHVFHETCFFSGSHITKVQNVMKKVMCPEEGCKNVIVSKKVSNAEQKLKGRIEIIAGSPPTQKETGGMKYVAYVASVILGIIIGGVISHSLIGIAIGTAVGVPIAYGIGRLIDRCHA